jgi:hypothetical protein
LTTEETEISHLRKKLNDAELFLLAEETRVHELTVKLAHAIKFIDEIRVRCSLFDQPIEFDCARELAFLKGEFNDLDGNESEPQRAIQTSRRDRAF